jgi:hypothetical protein
MQKVKNLTAAYAGHAATITIPMPTCKYLDAVMKLRCFPALIDLFRQNQHPAKELTESFSAFHHLREYAESEIPVVHVGDGAHCRTGAMFGFLTKSPNISIDPVVVEHKVNEWIDKWDVKRVAYRKIRIEEFELDVFKRVTDKVILTFVHSHVNSKEVIQMFESQGIEVVAAYVSACCEPDRQLTLDVPVQTDWNILSAERQIQVYKKVPDGLKAKL